MAPECLATSGQGPTAPALRHGTEQSAQGALADCQDYDNSDECVVPKHVLLIDGYLRPTGGGRRHAEGDAEGSAQGAGPRVEQRRPAAFTTDTSIVHDREWCAARQWL